MLLSLGSRSFAALTFTTIVGLANNGSDTFASQIEGLTADSNISCSVVYSCLDTSIASALDYLDNTLITHSSLVEPLSSIDNSASTGYFGKSLSENSTIVDTVYSYSTVYSSLIEVFPWRDDQAAIGIEVALQEENLVPSEIENSLRLHNPLSEEALSPTEYSVTYAEFIANKSENAVSLDRMLSTLETYSLQSEPVSGIELLNSAVVFPGTLLENTSPIDTSERSLVSIRTASESVNSSELNDTTAVFASSLLEAVNSNVVNTSVYIANTITFGQVAANDSSSIISQLNTSILEQVNLYDPGSSVVVITPIQESSNLQDIVVGDRFATGSNFEVSILNEQILSIKTTDGSILEVRTLSSAEESSLTTQALLEEATSLLENTESTRSITRDIFENITLEDLVETSLIADSAIMESGYSEDILQVILDAISSTTELSELSDSQISLLITYSEVIESVLLESTEISALRVSGVGKDLTSPFNKISVPNVQTSSIIPLTEPTTKLGIVSEVQPSVTQLQSISRVSPLEVKGSVSSVIRSRGTPISVINNNKNSVVVVKNTTYKVKV